MSIQPLSEIKLDDYGDEVWLGGYGHGMITIGEWVSGGCKKDRPDDWEELLKQARLIAAAPTMLEALENLENDAGQIPEHAWLMVKAAIALAKGDSK